MVVLDHRKYYTVARRTNLQDILQAGNIWRQEIGITTDRISAPPTLPN